MEDLPESYSLHTPLTLCLTMSYYVLLCLTMSYYVLLEFALNSKGSIVLIVDYDEFDNENCQMYSFEFLKADYSSEAFAV